jgi:hypothetical protein
VRKRVAEYPSQRFLSCVSFRGALAVICNRIPQPCVKHGQWHGLLARTREVLQKECQKENASPHGSSTVGGLENLEIHLICRLEEAYMI